MKDYIEIAKDNEVFQNYLPIEKEMFSLPISYLINLLHIIFGDDFKNWLEGILKARIWR
jgi:hypothetical protein